MADSPGRSCGKALCASARTATWLQETWPSAHASAITGHVTEACDWATSRPAAAEPSPVWARSHALGLAKPSAAHSLPDAYTPTTPASAASRRRRSPASATAMSPAPTPVEPVSPSLPRETSATSSSITSAREATTSVAERVGITRGRRSRTRTSTRRRRDRRGVEVATDMKRPFRRGVRGVIPRRRNPGRMAK